MKKLFFTLLTFLSISNILTAEVANINLLSSNISQNVTGAEISKNRKSIIDFGAKSDGKTDCLLAFRKAMKKAKSVGGLHIYVPKGTYLLNGPIHLENNVCIELEEGATLLFNENPKYYLPIVETSWEGTFVYNYSPFIYGKNLKNVAIIGKGKIDGNAGNTFSKWRQKQENDKMISREMNHKQTPNSDRIFGEGHFLRPQLIQFFNCEKITIEDIFITNSPFWCIHLLQCNNAICRGIRYDAKLVNNDGIDPEYTSNLLIEDIDFNNGDDNIAIKAGRDNDGRNTKLPSKNILIRNCKFKGLHGIVIGSEMSSGIENIVVQNCEASNYCKRGFFIKTNPDRGGYIKNIHVNNCKFSEVEDLIYITSKYAGEGENSTYFTKISDIHFENISCRKANNAAIVLQGTKAEPLKNISFTNITVDTAKIGLSMTNTDIINFKDCILGGEVSSAPSQVSHKDKIFR